MIPKPEFGDYHRFRVSIGLVLMAVGPIVFWFVLKESYDLFRTSAEIDRLTPVARWMVYIRQSLAAVALLFSAAVGVWLFFIGFDMFREGDRKWRELQDVHDEMLILERDERKAGLQTQSVEEIKESAKAEIRNEAIEELEPGDISGRTQPDTEHVNQSMTFEIYQEVLSAMTRKLELAYGHEYTILSGRKMRSLQYDVVLRASQANRSDLLIELKLWNMQTNLEGITKILVDYQIGNTAYSTSVNRNSKTRLILLIREPATDRSLANELSQWMKDNEGILTGVALRVVDRKTFEALSPESLRRVLDRDTRNIWMSPRRQDDE